jgi:glycosyltransferase involved in cell wall biosynthesis
VPSQALPSVTVVIPTRDRFALLQESVASVFDQRSVDWRLVVVDDASSDGTAGWLDQLDDPRVEIVRCTSNVERSAARNLGLARVATPYVLFLDDDDVLRPEALTRLVRGADAHPTAFAAAGCRVLFDEFGHRRRVPWPRWTVCRRPWREVLAGWIPVAGQTLFRTDLLRETGGWREDMIVAEDQEVWLRLGYERPAVLIPYAVMRYRLHGVSRAPLDTRVVERELREKFVAGLPDHDRRVGEATIVAWRNVIAANQAFFVHEHREAARQLLEIARVSPGLYASPVTASGLAISLGKAVAAGALPRRVGLKVEELIHGGREKLRFYPRSRADQPDGPEFWSLPFELPEDRGDGNGDGDDDGERRPQSTSVR